MSHIDWITRRLARVFAPVLLVAVLACREEVTSPSAPEPEPALAIAPTQALLFRHVSAAGRHTCGVTLDNLAYCWGDNGQGQLGDGTMPLRHLVPVAVAGGLRFRQMSAGDEHTCGVTTDNLAYCWGRNGGGQVGDGSFNNHIPTPVAVAGGLRFRQVAAGLLHTCGVTTDNLAYCWGDNSFGELGDGTAPTEHRTPVAVAGGLRFRQVSAGYQHTCGVTTDNLAYCWGFNISGELGDQPTVLHVRTTQHHLTRVEMEAMCHTF